MSDNTARLSTLDIVVLIAYFAVIFGIGMYFLKRQRTAEDYFLGGRDVPWWAVGAALFSSNIGSEHFIGLAGSGAASGLAVGHFEWIASVILLILGWVFVPYYLRSKVFTMPEFLERRYNTACRTYLVVVSLIAYIFTKIAVTLFAGAIILQTVLGWDMWKSALALIIATGIYTVAGGLRAVIYTEVIQTVILILGSAGLTVIGLNQLGGFSEFQNRVPEGFFHMMKSVDHPDFPWTGILFGAPILGIWYWCTDQVIVQRILSAKNEAHAKAGTVMAGYLKILPVFILVLPGMIAHALFPNEMLDNSNAAFPILVVQLMPSGMLGIMIAAMLAALMSSLAAVFHSCSTLFTNDIYRRLRPNSSEQWSVRVGRTATVVMASLGMLWIPFLGYISDQLYIYLQSVQAYIAPPIAAVFLIGIAWNRANGTGALIALLSGLLLGGSRFILELYSGKEYSFGWVLDFLVGMNFLHFAVLLFVVCSGILVAVSLCTAPPEAQNITGLSWGKVVPETGLKDGAYQCETELHQETGPAGMVNLNAVLACSLVFTMCCLWIYFR